MKQKTPWLEVFAAALPAALHALILLGRLHPDEVFQSLEIALHRAEGFGIVAWEWQAQPGSPQPWGIRNWAVPLLFSGLFKLGDALGITSPMGRRVLVALPQYALHAAMLAAVWRLTARRVSAEAARWALWLVALFGPVVWFGGRTLSEAFSVAFLVWGLERLDARDVKPAWWALGGALLGFAQVTRSGSAAAIAPAMAWLLLERRWKTFALATAGGVVVAGALGLLDFLTWGEWFHSLIHYVRFNVASGAAAAQFGASPWWYYLPRLLVAPFAVWGLVLAARRRSGAPMIFIAAAVGYFAIVSATAHKEERFIYPALVLLTVAGAPAFARWAVGKPREAGLVAALGLLYFVAPTPFDVQRKEQFQLTRVASADATGFVLVNEGVWGSPGYFWLGKNLFWCTCDFPEQPCFQRAMRDPGVNRGVYVSNQSPNEVERDARTEAAFLSAGFKVLERRGPATLYGR